MSAPSCPYCGRLARLVKGHIIYRTIVETWSRDYWYCGRCDACVGCHKGTDKPLGTLANKELRAARLKTHEAFDPVWKAQGLARYEAYLWLSVELGLPLERCHIGQFDLALCERVIALCQGRREIPVEQPEPKETPVSALRKELELITPKRITDH